MIDYICIREKPWTSLGIMFEENKSYLSDELIQKSKLDWLTLESKMTTETHGYIPNYHALYRSDTASILGVVNNRSVNIVQNTDTFHAVEPLIGSSIYPEVCSELEGGRRVFGCFKVAENYKIFDDDIDQYFVILNDHLKPDGKVTVLYTPIRVSCSNTLSAALKDNYYRFRIPITSNMEQNQYIIDKIINNNSATIQYLSDRSQYLYSIKTDDARMDTIMDTLFPYSVSDSLDILTESKENEKVDIERSYFKECLDAVDLNNYRGTALQVFQAILDWNQHYYRRADKAYDINYRMGKLPGMDPNNTEKKMVSTLFKVVDSFAA